MKEFYEIKNLIIGKIYVCEQVGRGNGPITTTYNQKFIFEKKSDTIAEEVISGDSFHGYEFKKNRYNISNKEKNMYDHIFNTKYVVEPIGLSEYLSEIDLKDLNLSNIELELYQNGLINKWTVIEIYNYLNFELKEQKQLQM